MTKMQKSRIQRLWCNSVHFGCRLKLPHPSLHPDWPVHCFVFTGLVAILRESLILPQDLSLSPSWPLGRIALTGKTKNIRLILAIVRCWSVMFIQVSQTNPQDVTLKLNGPIFGTLNELPQSTDLKTIQHSQPRDRGGS